MSECVRDGPPAHWSRCVSWKYFVSGLFFFFQAEDGIRDVAVTGVQTCALPISPIGDEAACEFPLLAIEELFAGKIRAMIDRQHPRDLYDLFRFRKANLSYDSEIGRASCRERV